MCILVKSTRGHANDHAFVPPPHTHTHSNVSYSLLFRCKSGFVNAPQCYANTYIACLVEICSPVYCCLFRTVGVLYVRYHVWRFYTTSPFLRSVYLQAMHMFVLHSRISVDIYTEFWSLIHVALDTLHKMQHQEAVASNAPQFLHSAHISSVVCAYSDKSRNLSRKCHVRDLI